MQHFQTFLNDESGAISVDWVVLTVAAAGLAVFGYLSVSGNVTSFVTMLSTLMANADIAI